MQNRGDRVLAAHWAAMAEVAGMRHDCARPSAARAATSSGKRAPAAAAPAAGVAPATRLHAARLVSITRGPPTASVRNPSGTCVCVMARVYG